MWAAAADACLEAPLIVVDFCFSKISFFNFTSWLSWPRCQFLVYSDEFLCSIIISETQMWMSSNYHSGVCKTSRWGPELNCKKSFSSESSSNNDRDLEITQALYKSTEHRPGISVLFFMQLLYDLLLSFLLMKLQCDCMPHAYNLSFPGLSACPKLNGGIPVGSLPSTSRLWPLRGFQSGHWTVIQDRASLLNRVPVGWTTYNYTSKT